MRAYADTSVFGGAFDEEFARASHIFFEQVRSSRLRLVLSPIVEEEISDAPDEVGKLYASIASISEVAPLTAEVVRLQEAYLEASIVGRRWAADALHVAHASVHGCQVIVSWNFKHIVHYDKVAMYNAINTREGFSPIGIHTPQEVIDYESEGL
ncbi:MAG: type II toxin-antitoxin system VapC family toxin [Phycisphaerae bacterium]|nr:type II toxin-antitoxin system VapC family toxin [Phycisphaerae bacterium]